MQSGKALLVIWIPMAKRKAVISQRSNGYPKYCNRAGFTLIELLVVLGIIALLLSIVVPRYIGRLELAKETALIQTLRNTRDSIDKFYADKGRYPDALQELVESKYLSQLPFDPINETTDQWVIEAPDNPDIKGQVMNLRSRAEGQTRLGVMFRNL